MADIAVEGSLRLLDRLISFLSAEITLKNDVRDNIKCISSWLKTMKAFVTDKEGTRGGSSHVLQDQVRQVRDFAYDIEDIVDDFMFHATRHVTASTFHNLFHFASHRDALRQMSSKIHVIRKKIENFAALDSLRLGSSDAGPGRPGGSGPRLEIYLPSKTPKEDEVFGFQSLKESVIKQLLSEEPTRRGATVSIVGAAGSGKTTLAKIVYGDRTVREKFDCRAWVRVSRNFDLEESLRSVAVQFCGRLDDESVLETLRSDLRGRKYLVVLDDVWRNEDWERVADALPAGCRIVVTTSNNRVAGSCVEDPTRIHELNGLPWEESWNLFCRKAFGCKGACPPELKTWVELILAKCEGLPLSVTAVAALLSKKRQIPIEWKKFHDGIGTDLSLFTSILPGYDDLRGRSDLKSCFLYFSVFPEDYSVYRERLIRLWIAEGFVKKERNRSLEEVAEDNLNELVHRNLVHVTDWSVDGRVRSCRVLNLVRRFVIGKSEEENFVKVLVPSEIGHCYSSGDRVRRLSYITDAEDIAPPGDENSNHAHSAFLFGCGAMYDLGIYRLARVLDMQGAVFYRRFPSEILELRLLRYLNLRNSDIKKLPESIKKLPLLETIDLKATGITRLPKTVFRLPNLRNLLVSYYQHDPDDPTGLLTGVQTGSGIGSLTTLHELSLVKANPKMMKELKNLVNLRKLGIVGLRTEDGTRLCMCLQRMHNLSSLKIKTESKDVLLDLESIPDEAAFEFLQRLFLKGRLKAVPRWISGLHSLIKINLRWSRMDRSPLDALQDMPNLMELEMFDSYVGDSLEFRPNTFKKLRILHIELFNELDTVLIPEAAVPRLEIMRICDCKNMKTLPRGISGLACLKELIATYMDDDFVKLLQDKDCAAVRHIHFIQCSSRRTNRRWSRRKPS